jgi:thiamine transport system substrate-binding protein
MPASLRHEFEHSSGYTLRVLKSGDAGELTNKLVLTKDHPLGDVVFGLDNTFATRAVDAGVLTDYSSPSIPASADRFALDGAAGRQLTPIDWGDVCVNVDNTWFDAHHLAPPRTLEDLTRSEYKELLVTPAATTSSTGFAFLLATIGKYGEQGWRHYWQRLLSNGTKVVDGWSEAYEVDFTGGGGDGDRPLVVSYNSSPPFTIPKGTTRPTTSALLDTCFRQVEYAGVLHGASNTAGARAFVDFMTTKAFQESLPENMYVFPVDSSARLPKLWARWAPASPGPFTVDPAEVTQRRSEWLREWSDLTTG